MIKSLPFQTKLTSSGQGKTSFCINEVFAGNQRSPMEERKLHETEQPTLLSSHRVLKLCV